MAVAAGVRANVQAWLIGGDRSFLLSVFSFLSTDHFCLVNLRISEFLRAFDIALINNGNARCIFPYPVCIISATAFAVFAGRSVEEG